MVEDIRRRSSWAVIFFSGLVLTFANTKCSNPELSRNTQVVPLHSDVNLTCPDCDGETWWSRHNRTDNLQRGSRLSLGPITYQDEDNYTCYRAGAPVCTVQLLVEDDIETPQISCYIRNPTHNITCDWQTTRELRPHAKVTLIEWKLIQNHSENICSYSPATRKFTCSTPYEEGDTDRHTLSVCVIGRTGRQISNTVESTMAELVQPDPPINVTVTSLEDRPRRLRVSWSPPTTWHNFYKLVYQVQYRVEGSYHISNGTTEEERLVISDALARRRHVIRVRAKEEYSLTWSAWSEEVTGTPWSAEEDETPETTEFQGIIITSAEEGDPQDPEEKPPSPTLRYVWLVGGVSFVMVLLLSLGIVIRNREIKLLKLKGLRTLLQPWRSAPAVPQSGDPLQMAPCLPPQAVTVTIHKSCD